MNFETLVFQQLNSLAGSNTLLDGLAVFFADYAGFLLIGILGLLAIKNFKKYKYLVVESFISIILSRFIITEIIRFFYFRARPFTETTVNLLLSHLPTASFPSGHAAFFFAFSTTVYFYNKSMGAVFFLASFLMGLARVYSGIHWPLDILAGALIGIISAFIMRPLFGKVVRRFLKKS